MKNSRIVNGRRLLPLGVILLVEIWMCAAAAMSGYMGPPFRQAGISFVAAPLIFFGAWKTSGKGIGWKTGQRVDDATGSDRAAGGGHFDTHLLVSGLILLVVSAILVVLGFAAKGYLEQFAQVAIACGALATLLGSVLVVTRKMR